MVELDEISSLSELKSFYKAFLPNHVGLILDGNRRWIKKQGIDDTLKGHLAGYNTLRNVLRGFLDAGIQYLSIYALSVENIRKRSPVEIDYLFKLLLKGVEETINSPEIHQNQVNIQIVGRLVELPNEIQKAIKKINDITVQYHKYFIQICINYDGQEEIVDAVKSILQSNIAPDKITRELIKKHLYTAAFPEVDYIIRTGMEDGARISGFLLWDSSYAEFCFRSDLWPDYNTTLLLADLKEFIRRNRRKGA